MSADVRISVITATWNSAPTIEACILSLASQVGVRREHLIIDGGSTDGTVDVVRQHADLIDVCISEPDHGIYDALNKGLRLAGGDVVGFLHSDDVYACTDTLQKIAHAFRDPDVCAVYGDLQYVDRGDLTKVVRHWKSSRFEVGNLRRGWMPPHPTLYVRREWYEKIGGFDLKYRIAADYFSILNLFSSENFRSVYLPEVLVKMRVGGVSNRSLRNLLIKSNEDLDALRRSGVGGIRTLVLKNLSKIHQFF